MNRRLNRNTFLLKRLFRAVFFLIMIKTLEREKTATGRGSIGDAQIDAG
jgi:hypothetical protein